jgi:hypothetical protein
MLDLPQLDSTAFAAALCQNTGGPKPFFQIEVTVTKMVAQQYINRVHLQKI